MPVCLCKRLIECIINISRPVFTSLAVEKNVQCLYTEREIKSMFSRAAVIYKPLWAQWCCYGFTVCLLWVTKPVSYNGPFSLKSIICQKRRGKEKDISDIFWGKIFFYFLLVLLLSLHYHFFYHIVLFYRATVEYLILLISVYIYLLYLLMIYNYNFTL